MKKKLLAISGLIVPVTVGLLYPGECLAQSYRYIDKSGNIFWADSIDQVPREYRDQIIKPTPKPILSKKQQRQIKAEEQRLKREEEKEEKEKERKKKQLEKQREKQKKKNEKSENLSDSDEQDQSAHIPGPSAKADGSKKVAAQPPRVENPSELEDEPEQE